MPEISTLPSITTLVPDTDVLAIVSDGDTKKISPTAAPDAAPNILATDANGSIAFDTDLLVIDAVSDTVTCSGTLTPTTVSGYRPAPTLTVAASTSRDKNSADYVCDGTADDVQIQAALTALTSGGTVALLEGTYNLAATLAPLADTKLCGQGWGTILDVHSIAAASPAITMAVRSTLGDLKIFGDISPLETWGRSVATNDHCRVENIWISNNNFGVGVSGKTNVTIDGLRCDNIKASNSWAACINVVGSSVYDVKISNFYMDDCNRGIEVENGAERVSARTGYIKDINGDQAFSLDVHTHNGQGICKDILFENIALENCRAPSVTGVDWTDDWIQDVTLRNITVISPAMEAWEAPLYIQYAKDVLVDGFTAREIDNDDWINIGHCYDVVLKNICMREKVGASARGDLHFDNSERVTIEDTHFNASEVRFRGGADILVSNCRVTADDFTPTTTSVRVDSSMARGTFKNLILLHASANSFYVESGCTEIDLVGLEIPNATTYGLHLNYDTGRITRCRTNRRWNLNTSDNLQIYENTIDEYGIDGGLPNNCIAYNNIGFDTEGEGTATALNATTFIDVAHGLDVTPGDGDIQVTPTNNLGNAAKFWISDVGASTFRINVDADPGATTATFAWKITTYP